MPARTSGWTKTEKKDKHSDHQKMKPIYRQILGELGLVFGFVFNESACTTSLSLPLFRDLSAELTM